ncbi:MAG: hypothetical protein ACR2P6_04155 [Gammaproteobacteria bacterium]
MTAAITGKRQSSPLPNRCIAMPITAPFRTENQGKIRPLVTESIAHSQHSSRPTAMLQRRPRKTACSASKRRPSAGGNLSVVSRECFCFSRNMVLPSGWRYSWRSILQAGQCQGVMRQPQAHGIYPFMSPENLKYTRIRLSLLLSAALFLVACASAPSQSTIIRTLFDLPENHSGFGNTLIISVAGDYESRALMETLLAAEFFEDRARATASYTVLGRQTPLTRARLETAILSRSYDSVLLVRQKNQERADLVANRPVGQGFDLFGYDYAELNYAESIRQAPAITFVSEIYSTLNNKKVWAIDSLSFDKETATDLINEQASTIAAQLRKDRVLLP